MKLVISAAAIAILVAAGPAAAEGYGGKDNNFFKVPTAPQPPQPPRLPGERDTGHGYRADRPFKPYEGVKEQRHYNIYTNRWE